MLARQALLQLMLLHLMALALDAKPVIETKAEPFLLSFPYQL